MDLKETHDVKYTSSKLNNKFKCLQTQWEQLEHNLTVVVIFQEMNRT